MNVSHHHSRRAFTLLELLVVLAIAAMLSSVVMLSLRSHFQHAALARAVDSIITADRLARRMATEQLAARVVLEFDSSRHRLKLLSSANGAQPRNFSWPSNVALSEPWVLGPGDWRSSNGSLDFSATGSSATYYVQVTTGNVSQCLVILGLTGQATVYPSADSLQELLP